MGHLVVEMVGCVGLLEGLLGHVIVPAEAGCWFVGLAGGGGGGGVVVVAAAPRTVACVGGLSLLGDREGVQHLEGTDLGGGRLGQERSVWGG